MKHELSIQMYSVRDHMGTEQEAAETFRKLASYGFTGAQTAGAFPFGVERYAELAKEAGLRIIGTHTDFNLLRRTEEAVRVHRVLGTTNAGIGGMPGIFAPEFCPKTVTDFIEQANEVAKNLAPYGMKFTYHNHAKELTKIGNETVMEILARELDPKNISFVLDVYWLQHGGVSPVKWIEKLAGRIDILHLKDKGVPFGSNDGAITELGAGNIDFTEILRAAEAAGVKEYCYEQDTNFAVDSLESARVSAEFFASLVG